MVMLADWHTVCRRIKLMLFGLLILIQFFASGVETRHILRRQRQPTTTSPTLPTTTPLGCFYNNKFYPPGTEIDSGYDSSSNWCYGTTCTLYGNIQNWDNFNCHTTPPTTTAPTTIPPGCFYNNKFYAPGTEIQKGYDASSNWCYGTYCSSDGHLIHADNFNCHTTQTTIPPTFVTTKQPTTIKIVVG